MSSDEESPVSEASHRQRERLDFALSAADLGQWELNLSDQSTQRTARHDEIFGYSTMLPEWTFEMFLEHVVPHDRERVAACFAKAVGEGALYDIECRIRRADGVERWIWTKARVQPASDGEADWMMGLVGDITERKVAEEAARRSHSRLESTLAAGHVGTWELNVTNDAVWADANVARMFGVSKADANGGPFSAYIGAVHPDDIERVLAAFTSSIENRTPYEAEYRVIAPDGTTLSVVARGRVEIDANDGSVRVPGVVINVSGQREAEKRERALLEEAALADAKFRALFDQGAWFALILTVDGLVVEVNRRASVDCGFERDSLIGQPFWDGPWWSPNPSIVARIRAGAEQAATGELFKDEVPFYVADGSQRFGEIIILPITDASGRVVFLAPTGIDITETKRATAELAHANAQKDTFLATLAHELRNPLAPISNGLDLMRLAAQDAVVLEKTRAMMDRQLKQLVRLVDDLLDLSRISRDKLELRKEEVTLAAVLRSAVETSRPLIEKMGHRLELEIPETDIRLDADLTRLAQVFLNLLNNAAKYSERGGRISLAVNVGEDTVEVSISDDGIGLEPASLSTIFEMFSQGPSGEKAQGGLGIGLTLAKRLVDLHGGELEARSDGIGEGSQFIVRLPLLRRAARLAATPVRIDGDSTGPLRILVVDDNEDCADSLELLLARRGNSVRTAYDGVEALRIADEFRPDVIVLDIGLPRMDGREICRRIRAEAWGAEPVLIALTGWGQDEDRAKTREAGFDHHMVKPVEIATLLGILSEASERPTG